MLDRSRGREIPGRPSLPRPLPKPERQLNPRSRRMRDGRRDPVDPSRDRLSYQRRLERSLVDVGVYQSVSFRDLAEAHFDGHPYVARRAVNQWIRAGAFKETTARGPKGNSYKVLAATPAGAELARRKAVELGLDSEQRTWSGLVKPGELAHDTEVYRAARAEIKRLLANQAAIRRIRIDAELKSIVAKRSETARARDGKAAADIVIHGNGRGASRVSKALGRSGSKGIRGLRRKGDPPTGGTRGPADRRDGSVEL